jgi:hypothetical protein
LGWVSAVDSNGRTIWIVDAHRDDGKRFVVPADEKLTAFRPQADVTLMSRESFEQRCGGWVELWNRQPLAAVRGIPETTKQARLQTKRQVLNELLARELLGDRKRAASRLISPHGLVGRGEYGEYGATAGCAGKCESHRTTDTPQARETTRPTARPKKSHSQRE